MNRYTQLTPSQFNPLSLEEIMLVPAMQRKKHDDLLVKQEEIRSGLAKVNPLDVHYDEAMRLKQGIEAELDATAKSLAEKGIDPNTSSKVIALNRKYNDLVAPTGRIGQINTAKQVYVEKFNNYMKDAIENKKWSRELALKNWQEKHHSKYTGYDDENKTNIKNISDYGAPDKIETMSELKKIKDILGDQVVSEIFNQGNFVRERADGNGYEVINKNGSRVVTSNDPNIQQALGLIKSRILDKNGDIRKSIEFEGRDVNTVWNEYNQGTKAMLSNKISDDRNTTLGLDAVKNQGEWNEMNAVGQLIENTTSFLPKEFSSTDYNTNKQNLDKLLNLQKSGNLTKEQKIELDKLSTFQKTLNENLKNDKTYNNLNTNLNSIISKSGLSDNLQKQLKDAPFINTAAAGISGRNRTIYVGDKLVVVTPEELNKIKNIESTFNKNVKNKQEIENKYTKENSIMSVGYGMFPTTKKEETEFGVLNDAFFTNLKADPQALRKYLNIETVEVSGQNVKPTNNDKEGLSKLFSQYGDKGKIVSFIPKGFGGKPEYIIEFETGDNKYDMDGVFGSGNEDVGGKVRMKVSFNRMKGNKLGNVNNAALKYLSGKGEINPNTGLPIGADIAKESASNIYSYSTYNDLLNDQSHQWQNDEILKSEMQKTMVNDLKTKGAKSPFYGQPQSKYMQIFMDHYGDEFITK